MTDFIEQFTESMRNAGLDPAETPVADSVFRRICDKQDRPGKKDLFYILHEDGIPAGNYGHWSRLPDGQNWQAKDDNTLTPQERTQVKERIDQSRAARDKARNEIRATCRAKAAKMLEASQNVQADHAYLKKKRVKPYGARQLKDMLLIPVRKKTTLTGLQIIMPDGSKKFLTGTEKTGAYFVLRGKGKVVYLVEGWATGCTIHELTGATVIICFDCGNLEAVSKEIKATGPDYEMIVVADNDRMTEGNPGLTKARAAALATGARLAIPTFPGDDGTDANDLAEISGGAAVISCLEAAAMVDTGTVTETAAESCIDPLTAAVDRLAKLSPLEYDKVRKGEAKALGVRPVTLDAAIKGARKEEVKDSPFEDVEPWHEPVDGAALLTTITATIRRFVICNQETAYAVALWIAMTWFIDVVQIAPLAIITAPEKRCGKSMLLFLIGRLVPRPLMSSSITPSALFRSIDAWQPTLLIDEVDACLKDNEELRGLINCGHTRDSAFTIRCVGDDHTPKKFNVWGAKALSGIGHVADTLMDRSIILELRRKLPHESIDRIRYAEPCLFSELCSKLARFADDNSDRVRLARPDLPCSLNDRMQDNWEPLLAIAIVAGGDWFKIGTAAALKLSGGESLSLSIGTELLADIQEIFEHKKVDRISSVDLIRELCADDEKPWGTFNKGFQIKPRQIAAKLKGYGIHSKNIRLSFGETPKGYSLEQFQEAFIRYVSATPSVTSATTPQISTKAIATVADNTPRGGINNEKATLKPTPIAACGVVADRTPIPASDVIDMTGIDFEVMS
jgi:putative DNA primase/helicase